jgi:hypothetical protein
MVALAKAIETIAGRHHPGIGRQLLQRFAVVLKNCRMLGRHSSKVVEGFIHPGSQARRGDVVTQNSTVHQLGEECPLAYEFLDKGRNVPLPIRRKRFRIPRTSAEGDTTALRPRGRAITAHGVNPSNPALSPAASIERKNSTPV